MKLQRLMLWLLAMACLFLLVVGGLTGCETSETEAVPSVTEDGTDAVTEETAAPETENDCPHEYVEQSNEATCTERGVATLVCTLCGHTRRKLSNPLGHDYIDYVCRREGCGHVNVYYAADYGVVGDGITDDGPAISDAINAVVGAGGKLIFEANKTYYIGTATNSSNPFVSPFVLQKADGVTVDGQGATFLFAPDLTYMVLTSCHDVTLKDCSFDYAVPVYLVGTVTKVEGKTITYAVDVEPYTDFYDYSGITAFSVKARSGVQNYAHGFIKTMTKTGSKEITIVHSSGVGNYRVGNTVYLPNPGVGHVGNEAIFFGGNTGTLTLENVQICAARNFSFSIKGNDAEMFFNNVDLTPAPDNDRAVKMVGWRDGFHCKDNRGPIHWSNCENGVLFDDVFNIRNTLGAITSVVDSLTFRAYDFGHSSADDPLSFNCEAGDVLDFYDQYNDVYYGYGTVLSAVRSDGTTVITLETDDCTVDLTKVDLANCRIGNRMTCAPGSTIENCTFSGSFRFSRDLTVKDSTLNLLSLWILAEGGFEGPIPGNITFRGCTFRYGYIQIDGYNRWDTGQYIPNIGKQIRDIRAYDCTFTDGCHVRSTTGGILEVYENGVLKN